MNTPHDREAGSTLIELLITVIIIGATAGIVVPRIIGRDYAPRVIGDVMGRVRLRRREARLLAPQAAKTALQNFSQQPLVIDFARPQTTAPLRIAGTDVQPAPYGDGIDDNTGLPLTRINNRTGKWWYGYQGAPINFPPGWRLVSGQSPSLPPGAGLIRNSRGEVAGIPVSVVGFDAAGDAWGDRDGDGVAESSPQSLTNPTPASEAPFWTLYFTNGEEAAAVGVHATGYVEAWRWTASAGWAGWRGRTPEN